MPWIDTLCSMDRLEKSLAQQKHSTNRLDVHDIAMFVPRFSVPFCLLVIISMLEHQFENKDTETSEEPPAGLLSFSHGALWVKPG